jgi:hypothetical protein
MINHYFVFVFASALLGCAGAVETPDGGTHPNDSGNGGSGNGGSGASTTDAATCVWGVDELLAEVGVESSDRADCNATSSLDPASASLDCLESHRGEDGAEFAVNRCVDCFILSTYVLTPDDKYLHLMMEADGYGDAFREVKVEKCSELRDLGNWDIACIGAVTLYSCVDALPD